MRTKIHFLLEKLEKLDSRSVSIGYASIEIVGNNNPLELQEKYERYKNWNSDWFVFAIDQSGDFFVWDLKTNEVKYGMNDLDDDWKNMRVINNVLDSFIEIINLLISLSEGRSNPVQYENNPISDAERKNFKIAVNSLTKVSGFNAMEFWEDYLD